MDSRSKISIGIIIGIATFAWIGLSAFATSSCTSTFPTSLDNFITGQCIPSSGFNAMQAKMGVTSSSVTSSLDYQINHIFTSYGSEIVAANVSTSQITSTNLFSTTSSASTGTFSARLSVGGAATATATVYDYGTFKVVGTSTLGVTTIPTLANATVVGADASGTLKITTTTALGSNAFTSTAIPTSYVASFNGSTGAVTANIPAIATTTKSIFDGAPSTSTPDIMLYTETGFTLKQFDCVNSATAGNSVFVNIGVSSTANISTGTVMTSPFLCNSTSTIQSTTTFATTTIPAGSILQVFFSGTPSTTGLYVDIKY